METVRALILAVMVFAGLWIAAEEPQAAQPTPPLSYSFAGSSSGKVFPNGIRAMYRVDVSPPVTLKASPDEGCRFVAVHLALDFHRYSLPTVMALEKVPLGSNKPIEMGGATIDEEVLSATGQPANTSYFIRVEPREGLLWDQVQNLKNDLVVELTEKPN